MSLNLVYFHCTLDFRQSAWETSVEAGNHHLRYGILRHIISPGWNQLTGEPGEHRPRLHLES